MLETGKHGPELGVNALTRKVLPSPAVRYAPNPLISDTDGGHRTTLAVDILQILPLGAFGCLSVLNAQDRGCASP
ncbi:hypothetical protein StoSoilB22_11490 [Arthrobacter sp. StoSoilB22]|nr:hypothetical protein StoSoilB22_11490 [Arthrobacter sp. StoSoilB22]